MVNYSWLSKPNECSSRLEQVLSPDQKHYLPIITDLAKGYNYPIYIVGGFVRDFILGFSASDLDIVIEGDATSLAEEFVKNHGGNFVIHKRYMTTSIRVPSIDENGRNQKFDLVSARSEVYEKPGALPTIFLSTVKNDLLRRDFSINAIAIRLDEPHFGEIRDDTGGIDDLTGGVVRVLHKHSFRDDPTRIFRAARYAVRFGFSVSNETLESLFLYRDGISNLSAQRVRRELDLIMNEEKAGIILKLLDEWEILQRIHYTLKAETGDFYRVTLTNSAIVKEKNKYRWTLWLIRHSASTLDQIDKRLHFKRDIRKVILGASKIFHSLELFSAIRPSQLVHLLSEFPIISIKVVILVLPDGLVKDSFYNYLKTWRYLKPGITGDTLQKLGLKPGPEYNRILTKIRDSWLDGEIKTQDEEHQLLLKLITSPNENMASL